MSLQTTSTHVPQFTFGWRLRLAVEQSDESVGSLAAKLGYSRSQLSRWMRDDGMPRPTVVAAWAMATGVPVEWLRTGEEPTTGPDGGGEQGNPATYWYGSRGMQEMGRVAYLQVAA